MPHQFVDLDSFVPGGAGGLDDGDKILQPWTRLFADSPLVRVYGRSQALPITQAEFQSLPIAGWHSDDLYLRWPVPVRCYGGELLYEGSREMAYQGCPDDKAAIRIDGWKVFAEKPNELEDHTDQKPPTIAQRPF